MSTPEFIPQWGIGAIVALKSHFYSQDNDTENVYLTGEPLLNSPLMIVVEVLQETKGQSGVSKRKESDQVPNYRYKCMWYSSKQHQFLEVWISPDFLKLIVPYDQTTDISDQYSQPGITVEFRTAQIELGKKKSTLQKSLKEEEGYKITAHLSFVSPILQVIDVKENTSTSSKIDTKKNHGAKLASNYLIKCRYYNPVSDKHSEVFIPIEALSLVINDDAKISRIKEAIQERKFLKMDNGGILRPHKLHFRSGRFYLQAFDYIKSKDVSPNVNDIPPFSLADNYFTDQLPLFRQDNTRILVSRIDKKGMEELLKKIGTQRYLHIRYEDFKEIVTQRTVSDAELLIDENPPEDDVETDRAVYLKAYCHLRGAVRFFRLDRIQEIKVLDCEPLIVEMPQLEEVSLENGSR